jgi:acyl carrier protein
MNKKELKKLILRIINNEEVNDLKGYEWDSLAHLTILMELDKSYPDKITSINNIAEMNTYEKIEKALISKKLLNND